MNDHLYYIFLHKWKVFYLIDNLKKDAGDQVTIPLLLKLSGNGVVDDNILEGNEEALQYRDFAVTINQFRHAVKLKGKFEEQKSKLTKVFNHYGLPSLCEHYGYWLLSVLVLSLT